MSVCASTWLSAWKTSASTGRIFHEILFGDFSKICWENSIMIKIWQYILHEDLHTIMKISRWVLLGMRNISDKICSVTFTESLSLFEIMWKSMVEWNRPKMAIYEYNETNVIRFLFSLLRIKGLYLFRAGATQKRHLVYCVSVRSVVCTWYSQLTTRMQYTKCSLCSAFKDEQVMLETCRGP
jgi:hypothetical protein